MSGDTTDRRTVLKTIGASTAGLTLAAGSGAAGNSGNVDVLINPARQVDVSIANNEVYDAVDDFLTQLVDAGAIPGYDLSATSFPMSSLYGNLGRSPNKPCQPGALYDEYVNENGNDTSYDVSLYVTDDSWYGGGELNPGDGVWNSTRQIVWVGTSGNYDGNPDSTTERIKNAAIQEVGHAFIDDAEIDSADYYSGGQWHDAEHALGMIHDSTTSKPAGTATPMLVFYENSNTACGRSQDLSGDGGCSTSASWDGSHTQTVTSCTIDAVENSFDANWQ